MMSEMASFGHTTIRSLGREPLLVPSATSGIGLGCAWALTRYIRSIAVVVPIACIAPARHAARIDDGALREG